MPARTIEDCPIPPGNLAALIRTIDSGEISGKIAKTVFEEMCRTLETPAAVIQRMGLAQVSDEASLGAVIDKILASNPKQVAEYRSGKTKGDGLSRRPGNAGNQRPGQSASRQRFAAKETGGRLIRMSSRGFAARSLN